MTSVYIPSNVNLINLEVNKPIKINCWARQNQTEAPDLTIHLKPGVTPSPKNSRVIQLLKDVQLTLRGIILTPSKWERVALKWMNHVDAKLEENFPNNIIQDRYDYFVNLIEKKFSQLKVIDKMNAWLNENELESHSTAWYKQIALFLSKLPVRTARNILNLLYKVVKGLVNVPLHPLRSVSDLAKLFIRLVHALTQPEVWSKLGIGIVGGSLGATLTSGNPISAIGMVIGMAMLASGIAAGTLKAAIVEDTVEDFIRNWLSQLASLPESFLTGFLAGLLLGKIQASLEKGLEPKLPYKPIAPEGWYTVYPGPFRSPSLTGWYTIYPVGTPGLNSTNATLVFCAQMKGILYEGHAVGWAWAIKAIPSEIVEPVLFPPYAGAHLLKEVSNS